VECKIVHPNKKYDGVIGGVRFVKGEAIIDSTNISHIDRSFGESLGEILRGFEAKGLEVLQGEADPEPTTTEQTSEVDPSTAPDGSAQDKQESAG